MIDAFDAADKDDNIRAIIVTGAGRGIGRSTARALAGRGVRVMGVDTEDDHDARAQTGVCMPH